jgi:hypothetical protein
MKNTKAIKLIKILERVQQGIIVSEKYSRLFDSHIAMTAIHEASHAVIGTMLGLKVVMIDIEIERNEFDGRESISTGRCLYEPAEIRKLGEDRKGRATYAAMVMASALTRNFRFEWQIDAHLVEAGFSGDARSLELLNDEVAVQQGGHILWWALAQPFVIDTIESVAEALNKKRVMLGEELRKTVFAVNPNGSSDLARTFTKKEIEPEVIKSTGKVLSRPEYTPFKFFGIDLVVCSFLAKEQSTGRELILGFVSLPKSVDPRALGAVPLLVENEKP